MRDLDDIWYSYFSKKQSQVQKGVVVVISVKILKCMNEMEKIQKMEGIIERDTMVN